MLIHTSIKLRADTVADEERDAATTLLIQSDLQGLGDSVLARVVQAGQAQNKALLCARRVALTESLNDSTIAMLTLVVIRCIVNSLVAEPVRDGGTSLEALPELGARNVKGLDTLGNFVDRLVLVRRWEVRHHLEWYHLDLKFVVVLCDQILCVVRAVEVLALRVLTRTSVITTDDEVSRTKVLTDDRVPDGFTGTSHTHREWEEGKVAHAVRVLGHNRLVDTNTSVVVDVPGLGEADDGVHEHVGLVLASSADGELTVSTVHGVAGLEGDDLAPSDLVEVSAKLGGGV